jgi:hypothetical protein
MDFISGYSLPTNIYRQPLNQNYAYSNSNTNSSSYGVNNSLSSLYNLPLFDNTQSSFQLGNGSGGLSNFPNSNTSPLLIMLLGMIQLLTAGTAQANQTQSSPWNLDNQQPSQQQSQTCQKAQHQTTHSSHSSNKKADSTTKTTQAASSSGTGTSKAKDVKVTGTNYYVDSVHGSDSNDGLSPDKPLKSLKKVNQLDLKPGDGVNFAKGSTFNGELDVKHSGTKDKPIVYRSYGTGNAPVFKNSGDGWKVAVNVTGSHNVLDGLKLQDATIGVQFADGADNNTLQNSEATNVGRGVDVEGDGNNINSNYFHDLKMVINTVGGNDDNGANGVVIHSSNTTIENNRFERNIASSHDYGQDGGAVEIYAFKNKAINNTVIRGNTVSDSDGFIEVGADGRTAVNNTLIENNVSKNNGLFSVIHNAAMSKASDEDNAVISNYVVQNNTITEKNMDPNSLFVDGGTIKNNKYQKLN